MRDMSDVKIKLNIGGLNALRRSPEVMAALKAEAEAIANRAGHSTVETDYFQKRGRARVVQNMTTADMENNTLAKAVHFK